MNSFGRIFRLSIFGESHGPFAGITIDGCVAGLSLDPGDFTTDIDRRKGGIRPGTTSRKEEDTPEFISGIFNGKTTGAPLTMLFKNADTRSSDYEKQRSIPRPGHADLVAGIKAGGYEDYRGGGHYSGRLTVCLVAAGVVAKKILSHHNINASAKLIEAGGEADIEKGIQKAIDANDSIGGIVECNVDNLPAGLGEPFFDSAESLISHAIFAIPAIKGVEFGAGFKAARMKGSEHNDAIENASGKTLTNNSGGVTGGLTNGNQLIFRVVVKPASSTPKQQKSFNKDSGKVEEFAITGRHDLCIALRVPVVLEAVAACVLVDMLLIEQKVSRVVSSD